MALNKMTRRVFSVAAGLTLTGLTAIGAVNPGTSLAEGGGGRQVVSAPVADEAGFFTIIKWTWVGGRWVQTRTIQCFPNCTWGSYLP